MCGIFGFLSYGVANKDINEILATLAKSSAERGTDATGIAYLLDGKLEIEKAAKSAYQFKIDLPKDTMAVMGHTRHSTQGSEKHNANNHPFKGRLKNNSMFALAHNGVLTNDTILRKKFKLPKTQIQTDSYIAVQLLEQKGSLTMDSMKYMAEKVSGSFSFSILDGGNNIWLVKGDSPISILHFKHIKTYVYASTDKILWHALICSPLFDKLKNGSYEEVSIKSGQILKICSNGKLEYGKFDFKEYYSWEIGWWNYSTQRPAKPNDYLRDLEQVAQSMGYDPDQIEELYMNGFSYDEIEEYIYGHDCLYDECEV